MFVKLGGIKTLDVLKDFKMGGWTWTQFKLKCEKFYEMCDENQGNL